MRLVNFVWGYGGSLLFFSCCYLKSFLLLFKKSKLGLWLETSRTKVNMLLLIRYFLLPSFLPSFLSFLELCRYLIVVASGHQSGRQWGRQVINITDDIPTYFFRCNLFTFTVLRRESRRPFLNFQFCLQSIHF